MSRVNKIKYSKVIVTLDLMDYEFVVLLLRGFNIELYKRFLKGSVVKGNKK